MIKKLILMTLVIVGGVMTANAAKLYVCIDNVSWWLNDGYQIDIYSWDESNQSDNTGWGNHNYLTEPIYMYGNRWYVYDMPANHDKALVKRSSDSNNAIAQTWDIAVTNDAYVKIKNVASGDENKYEYDYSITSPSWSGLCLRNTIDNNWTAAINNMEIEGDIFRKSFTKEQIGTNAKIWFRLKHINEIAYDETGSKRDAWFEICATSNDTEMSLPGSTTEVDMSSVENGNTWVITVPSYDYEKIVITAKYINDNGYKWQISADAYLSPSLTKEYGTFSVAAPIDLSKATGLTAYYASNVSGSTVTMTKLEEAVAANTGLLLKKGEGEISIPVAASGTDLSNSNSLKYGTGATVASDPTTNRYVLATQGVVQNFYKLSTTGNEVPRGKAYLEIPASAGGEAPSLSIDIDGETTGIEVINAEIPELGTANGQTFDLSGRRISEPTKGVYIMNGKKIIVK